MFRSAYQHGFFTVFFSCGSKPFDLWDVSIKNGYINRFMDQEIKSTVVEIGGTNVSTSYMVCPKGNKVLGIKLPFLVMIVKNMKKYFTFEVTALDETGVRRRLKFCNFQSQTLITPLSTTMPMNLSEGWNRIQLNMADFLQKAYNKQFKEVHKLKVNANIRLRRIYFTDVLLPDSEIPAQYKIFAKIESKEKNAKPAMEDENKKQNDNLTKGSKTSVLSVHGIVPVASNMRVKDADNMRPAEIMEDFTVRKDDDHLLPADDYVKQQHEIEQQTVTVEKKEDVTLTTESSQPENESEKRSTTEFEDTDEAGTKPPTNASQHAAVNASQQAVVNASQQAIINASQHGVVNNDTEITTKVTEEGQAAVKSAAKITETREPSNETALETATNVQDTVS